MDWLHDLRRLMEVYLVNETRIKVRETVLDITRQILWQFSSLATNEILDVILPFLNQINNFEDESLRIKMISLVIDGARELRVGEKKFDHLVQIMNKCVVNGASGDFRLLAVNGMIVIFKLKFCTLPCK
jgi:hypothetical protein